jgi:hypothetical protein
VARADVARVKGKGSKSWKHFFGIDAVAKSAFFTKPSPAAAAAAAANKGKGNASKPTQHRAESGGGTTDGKASSQPTPTAEGNNPVVMVDLPLALPNGAENISGNGGSDCLHGGYHPALLHGHHPRGDHNSVRHHGETGWEQHRHHFVNSDSNGSGGGGGGGGGEADAGGRGAHGDGEFKQQHSFDQDGGHHDRPHRLQRSSATMTSSPHGGGGSGGEATMTSSPHGGGGSGGEALHHRPGIIEATVRTVRVLRSVSGALGLRVANVHSSDAGATLRVSEIIARGAASRVAGIDVGDCVLAVNDWDTDTDDRFVQLVRSICFVRSFFLPLLLLFLHFPLPYFAQFGCFVCSRILFSFVSFFLNLLF